MTIVELSRHGWTTPANAGQVGLIHGLPHSQGVIERVCNKTGICLIRLENGSLFKGHKDWWEPLKDVSEEREKRVHTCSTNRKLRAEIFAEF